MAQRLVRRLDSNTKQAYTPEADVIKRLQSIAETLPPSVQKPDFNNLQLYRPGKSADNPFGYKGQIALREQLVMSDALRKLMQDRSTHISSQDIEALAVQNGMLTMLHSALLKLVAGETAVEEVFRVLG